VTSSSCSPRVENNNPVGVGGRHSLPEHRQCVSLLLGNTVTGYNRIAVWGTITSSTTWRNVGIPYYVESDVTVALGLR
jgi:hypothetical protein